MTVKKIEELDKLLKNYIGDNKTIVDTKISRLTAPGENYGSILVKVDITLKNDTNNSQEDLYVVAKLIPEEELFRKVFNIQVTCKVEIAFYDTVVPTLQKFQRERGVQKVMDFFPEMYAARINLDGSETVDDNAVLMLENLVEKGYKNVDRYEGFDLPTIELVLKDLAALHAVPLALKLLEPDTFQSKIQPYLKDFEIPPPSEGERKFSDAFSLAYEILEGDEYCRPVIPQLKEAVELKLEPRRIEPFVTIGHGDFWINNTMVKFEDGKPVSNKMVDFQTPRYASPALDLFFLLWTSVKMDVLDEHYDDLIKFYHENFIKHLEELGCDTSAFSLDALLEELKFVAYEELKHVVFFAFFVVFAKKKSGPVKAPHDSTMEDVSDLAKERLIYFIRTCRKRGWLSEDL